MSGMMRSASCWISSLSTSFRFFIRASSSWSQLPDWRNSSISSVETPMLGLEECQYFLRVVVVHQLILQEGRVIVTSRAVNGRPLAGPAKPCRFGSDKRPNS